MLADLDLLLTAVFCAADDSLPKRPGNARRRITDAEVITLCVAQAVMGIASDRQFLRAARRQLGGLFPVLPTQDAFWKRRARLAEQIERLMACFSRDCPGYWDSIALLDSTPVECGRSVDTARRSQLAVACAHHYSRSHSRWFWGMRLHLLGAPDGTIRAAILASADHKERDVAKRLFAIGLRGGETIIADKGYAGAEFAAHAAAQHDATVLRPARKTEPDNGLHLSAIRQRIESIFWTLKDRLGLEAHQARTLHGLRARIASKLLAYSAGIWINWLTGRPTRAFADLNA
ncbi:MAG TPA: IS982 family transposase [Capillimicrobium sp.]|nr:IS982 family transposase [Capillimicrobium sp.]